MMTLMLDGTLADILPRLRERGVDPLLIKGAGTADWLYDVAADRAYKDIDLLVAPDLVPVAVDVLRELGFAPIEPPRSLPTDGHHHAVVVRDRPPHVEVEIHHTLFLLSAPAQMVWERISHEPRTITFAGTDVSVPSAPAAALIVVLHALQHGVSSQRTVTDLRQALERLDLDTWRQAATLAAELSAEKEFAAGLRLIDAGVTLADQLALEDQPVPRQLQLRAMDPAPLALGLERLLITPGLAGRAQLIAKEIVPSPAFMKTWSPIARRGPLGLACAYAWRPIFLAANLPRAASAWRRANRAARTRS
jgi:hypothetical protein